MSGPPGQAVVCRFYSLVGMRYIHCRALSFSKEEEEARYERLCCLLDSILAALDCVLKVVRAKFTICVEMFVGFALCFSLPVPAGQVCF